MKIVYRPKTFRAESLQWIKAANSIIREYQEAGYDLTLRQLYYQFVARDLIPNTQRSYDKLGVLVNEGRLAGLIDWDVIVDRTRNLLWGSNGSRSAQHWDNPASILKSAADSFALDKWEGQEYRVEVWIEKEALAGVLQAACPELDVPYFSCRGYVSQSEQWRAAMRMHGYRLQGQQPVIIHLGDHDPSGIDMTRDISDRINDTFGVGVEVVRIALNMDQVEEYSPPPNPAKMTDSRFADYMREYGSESWELDSLDPTLLGNLIRTAVLDRRDEDLWAEKSAEEDRGRAQLLRISDRYHDVVEFLEEE